MCIFQKPENLGSGRFDHDWLWYEINLGKQYYINEISFLPTSDCNNNDYNNNCSKLYNFIKLKKTSLNEIDLKPLIKRKKKSVHFYWPHKFHIRKDFSGKKLLKQESIPVGCVLSCCLLVECTLSYPRSHVSRG